jgi:hypothetical protein
VIKLPFKELRHQVRSEFRVLHMGPPAAFTRVVLSAHKVAEGDKSRFPLLSLVLLCERMIKDIEIRPGARPQ